MIYFQANLVKYCSPSEPPCPVLCVEKLVFEMDKSFRETRLQLLLSPVLLKVGLIIHRNPSYSRSILFQDKDPDPHQNYIDPMHCVSVTAAIYWAMQITLQSRSDFDESPGLGPWLCIFFWRSRLQDYSPSFLFRFMSSIWRNLSQ